MNLPTCPLFVSRVLPRPVHSWACAVVLLANVAAIPVAGALEAGYAEADITPVLGTPLAGRLERWGRGSESIRDPLRVRCLFLQSGEERIYLVSSDLYSVTEELRTRVHELASEFAPPERIVLAATHTHSGPGGMDRGLVRRVNSGRYSRRVVEDTAQQFTACIREAFESRRRAAVGFATAEWSPPENLSGVNARPSRIGVVRVEDSDGTPISIVVTAPLVPDNVGVDELLTLSADFPGRICKTIGETIGSASAMFLNGVSGDSVRLKMQPKTSWPAIHALGDSIATFALELSDTIECAEIPINLNSAVEVLPPALGSAWLPEQASLVRCTLGGLSIAFVPFGVSGGVLNLGDPADAANLNWIVGYANGFAGHVVAEAAYATDTAAARSHHFGPRMAAMLTARVQHLGNEIETAQTAEPTSANGDAVSAIREVDGVYYVEAPKRGAALPELIHASFERRIREPSAAGELLPRNHMLANVPWFVDASSVTLPQLAFEIRPAWAALDDHQRQSLYDYADGANLPLEAAWLLQHERALWGYAGESDTALPDGRALMFAIHGDTAGAEGLLAGMHIPWEHEEPPLVYRNASGEGLPVVSISPAHALGAIAGMNADGVIACAVPNHERGRPRMAEPPLTLQLERALSLSNSAERLIQELTSTASLDGYDVFIADATKETAVTLQGSFDPKTFSTTRGLLLDRPMEAGSGDEDRTAPRRRLVDFVKSAERIVSAEELASFVAELDEQPEDQASQPALSVIFEPKSRRIRLRFTGADPIPDAYTVVPLEAGTS